MSEHDEPSGRLFEDGCGTVGMEAFDYDTVDENCFNVKREEPRAHNEINLFQDILLWVCGPNLREPGLITHRSVIACWKLLAEVRLMSLEDIANGTGFDLPALEKLARQFDRRFAWVKRTRMKSK